VSGAFSSCELIVASNKHEGIERGYVVHLRHLKVGLKLGGTQAVGSILFDVVGK
jgi:hypothetical protein